MNALVVLLVAGLAADAGGMAAASKTFLEGLSAEQRMAAMLPFEDAHRLDWHFFPRARQGVPMKDLDEAQRALGITMLEEGLSATGVEVMEQVLVLEALLQELEGGNPGRDPGMFHFTIFGEPKEGGTWGLRYEGHHISLNWTVVAGEVVSSSPQFLGANPAEVLTGPHAGLRPLGPLQDLAFDFLESLDEAQRGVAIVADQAPADIFTGADSQARRLEAVGIGHGALTPAQQADLWALIEAYAHIQAPALAADRLAGIREAGLDAIEFAWMGATERGAGPGRGHYYRVQGPHFLIEYDNIQNNANHAHTVWRDFDGDFGRDVLAAHHAAVEH